MKVHTHHTHDGHVDLASDVLWLYKGSKAPEMEADTERGPDNNIGDGAGM